MVLNEFSLCKAEEGLVAVATRTAGKQATYNVTLSDPGSFNMKIYWPGHGTVFNGRINDSLDYPIILPKIAIDANYEITITALSNITILGYSQFLD